MKSKRTSKYILLKKAIKIMKRNEGTFSCFQLWVCDAFSERSLKRLRKSINEYEKCNTKAKEFLQLGLSSIPKQ